MKKTTTTTIIIVAAIIIGYILLTQTGVLSREHAATSCTQAGAENQCAAY